MADNLEKKPKLEPASEPKQSAAPAPKQTAPKQPSFNASKKTPEQPKQVAKPQAQPKTGIPSASKPKADPVRKKIMDQGFAPKSEAERNALLHSETSQKSAPNPSWVYPTDAEKNGNFNYSEARKNGFKHPMTGKESSDLYFKNNYTGPGYSAFEGLQPMKDPNDFSQKFEESFHRFPSEENDSKGRPMVGEQKFYEDDDGNVWSALMEAKDNASDTDTVRDIISRASKESGIDEDRLLNALMFQHFYFGSDFAFSPESNYKKVAERQNKDYEKFLPKGRQPSDIDEREQASRLYGTDLNKGEKSGPSYSNELGFGGDTNDIEGMQSIIDNEIKQNGRIGGKLYDELDANGYYLDANNKVKRKADFFDNIEEDNALDRERLGKIKANYEKLSDDEKAGLIKTAIENLRKDGKEINPEETEDLEIELERMGYYFPKSDIDAYLKGANAGKNVRSDDNSLFTPEEEQEVWYPNNDKERKYVLENMREWMNEADNGPIDEDLMMKAYYAADDENGFDTTWPEEDVWNAVESKYQELLDKQGQGVGEEWSIDDNPGSAVVTKKLVDWTRDYLTRKGLRPEFVSSVVDNLHKDHNVADFYKGKMKEEYEKKKGGK